ncbi:MAG: helix-turn-helix domain-containing protein [Deinococcales bacterium]
MSITSRLPSPSLLNISTPRQSFYLQRKQSLYHVGDQAASIYFVRDGLLRITRTTSEGRLMTVRHVLPGDFFGEEAFTSQKRMEVAEALTSVEIEAIDPKTLPAGELLTVTHSLSKQMQRLIDYEYHLQTGDLRQRVARYLLKLADTPLAHQLDNGDLIIAATHELIAEGTGSTRESVSKIVTDLRNEGYINSGYRSVVLSDIRGLSDIANA